MTLQQLEYAIQLRKYGSYSRAAKAVGISQPAMSLQMQNLEMETGLTLFDRSSKPIKPTPEGFVFLEKAQLLLTQASQLKDLALSLSEELSGEINIGIIPTLAPYLIPLFISELNQQFSKLKIHIKEALTEEIIQGIKSGDLHGGIIATPLQTRTKFVTRPLFYEGFLLFVSDQHPLFSQKVIDIKDIPYDDVWLLKEGNCFRDQVDNLCQVAQTDHSNGLFFYESNSIEALCRVVEYRGGITFLPELTTLHFDQEREEMIKKIAGPKRVREISLIHLPKDVRMRIFQQVVEVIRASIPRYMLKKGDYEAVPIGLSFD